MATKVLLTGQYKYVLFWKADNTKNSAQVSRTFTFKEVCRVDVTEFRSAALSNLQEKTRHTEFNRYVEGGFDGAPIKSIIVKDNNTFNLVNKYYEQFDWSKTTKTETFQEREEQMILTVGANSYAEFYRLEYHGPGAQCSFGPGTILQETSRDNLPPLEDVVLEVSFGCQPFSWKRLGYGDAIPKNAFTLDTKYPLCKAECGTLRPGFVWKGRAEVCYSRSRYLVDNFQVMLLQPNARVTYIANEPPFNDEHHAPPNVLRIGGLPVCRASPIPDIENGLRPGFVHKEYAEIAYGESRKLLLDWDWVCIDSIEDDC